MVRMAALERETRKRCMVSLLSGEQGVAVGETPEARESLLGD